MSSTQMIFLQSLSIKRLNNATTTCSDPSSMILNAILRQMTTIEESKSTR